MSKLNMTEAQRLNGIRDRLVDALKHEHTMPGLRARLVELAADIEAWRDGRVPSSMAFRAAQATVRDTLPCPPPTSESDSAPPVPVQRPSGGP